MREITLPTTEEQRKALVAKGWRLTSSHHGYEEWSFGDEYGTYVRLRSKGFAMGTTVSGVLQDIEEFFAILSPTVSVPVEVAKEWMEVEVAMGTYSVPPLELRYRHKRASVALANAIRGVTGRD